MLKQYVITGAVAFVFGFKGGYKSYGYNKPVGEDEAHISNQPIFVYFDTNNPDDAIAAAELEASEYRWIQIPNKQNPEFSPEEDKIVADYISGKTICKEAALKLLRAYHADYR